MTERTGIPTEELNLRGLKIGFALTGSHCTLAQGVAAMARLSGLGAEILPIISPAVQHDSSRFGSAAEWREKICRASAQDEIIDSIVAAEPIGPKGLLDVVVIAPCSGNTLAKLANGITDSAVLMAAKAHLRNQRPVVLAIATNDGLGFNAKNIGLLLHSKLIYFVPFGQDDAQGKPNSLIADMVQIPQTVVAALAGKQIQPLLI